MYTDPATFKPYYCHAETGQSIWDVPTSHEVQQQEDGAATGPKDDSMWTAGDLTELGIDRLRWLVAKSRGCSDQKAKHEIASWSSKMEKMATYRSRLVKEAMDAQRSAKTLPNKPLESAHHANQSRETKYGVIGHKTAIAVGWRGDEVIYPQSDDGAAAVGQEKLFVGLRAAAKTGTFFPSSPDAPYKPARSTKNVAGRKFSVRDCLPDGKIAPRYPDPAFLAAIHNVDQTDEDFWRTLKFTAFETQAMPSQHVRSSLALSSKDNEFSESACKDAPETILQLYEKAAGVNLRGCLLQAAINAHSSNSDGLRRRLFEDQLGAADLVAAHARAPSPDHRSVGGLSVDLWGSGIDDAFADVCRAVARHGTVGSSAADDDPHPHSLCSSVALLRALRRGTDRAALPAAVNQEAEKLRTDACAHAATVDFQAHAGTIMLPRLEGRGSIVEDVADLSTDFTGELAIQALSESLDTDVIVFSATEEVAGTRRDLGFCVGRYSGVGDDVEGAGGCKPSILLFFRDGLYYPIIPSALAHRWKEPPLIVNLRRGVPSRGGAASSPPG